MLAKRISVAGPGWAGILVLVGAVLLVAGSRSAGAAEGWLVREQSGTLQYRLAQTAHWSRAAPGLELRPGTTVRAGSGQPSGLGRAQSSIVIRAGAELTLPPPDTETVVQWRGSVRYQVEPGSVPGFFVETRYLVIGIKGTIFDVRADEAGTEVRVSEGLVEVATPDGRFRAVLARGQIAWVGAAPGSALQVRQDSAGADAPVPPASTGSAFSDRTARSDPGSPLTAEVGGLLSPLTSTASSLWSGVGDLLSGVDSVHDDRLTTRPGTLVRTVSGGVATLGGSARGDSRGDSGGGNAGRGNGGGSSSGGGRGNGDSGSGGGAVGGLGGAVGGAVGSVGGAVGGLGNAVGGALGNR